MITFFTCPRPFEGEFVKLQRTAIQSWMTAVPGCEIVFFEEFRSDTMAGWDFKKDNGIGSRAVEYNDAGTPLINSAFTMIELFGLYTHNRNQLMWHHDHDLLCYISADIILGGDFQFTLEAISDIERPFVIGQRWDIDRDAPVNTAVLHDPAGIDYFIYRRGTLGEIPPFAVGRTAYDNWLVWAAVEKWGMTVIDATHDITAIHVNHGYPGFDTKAEFRSTQEVAENRRLFRESGASAYGVKHAPFVLVNGEVKERE